MVEPFDAHLDNLDMLPVDELIAAVLAASFEGKSAAILLAA